jgi:DNA-binding transcriptional ArsR family regulator
LARQGIRISVAVVSISSAPLMSTKGEVAVATCVVANILKNMSKAALDPKHFAALRAFKAGVFKVLAHPTRIHVIETLRAGELSVGQILEHVKVEPANLSQHLSLLRHSHLVVTRKEGNQVLYSLRDPLLIEVLDAMRQYFQRHFEDSIQILKQMEQGRLR